MSVTQSAHDRSSDRLSALYYRLSGCQLRWLSTTADIITITNKTTQQLLYFPPFTFIYLFTFLFVAVVVLSKAVYGFFIVSYDAHVFISRGALLWNCGEWYTYTDGLSPNLHDIYIYIYILSVWWLLLVISGVLVKYVCTWLNDRL